MELSRESNWKPLQHLLEDVLSDLKQSQTAMRLDVDTQHADRQNVELFVCNNVDAIKCRPSLSAHPTRLGCSFIVTIIPLGSVCWG
jgi:hypothetical protein